LQAKGNFKGIAIAIAEKIAAACAQKMAFYDGQGVLTQFLSSTLAKTKNLHLNKYNGCQFEGLGF
jgi:hypothetical protein